MTATTITIRTMTADDLEVANEIVVAAYAMPSSRQMELARYLRFRPQGWLLALLDGAAAGVVGAIDYGPFAYVGLMGVHPRAQRRGVALALMRRLLADQEARGCPVVLLDASAAGEPLYRRLGFMEDARALQYQRVEALQAAIPGGSVEPLRPAMLDAVARFDQGIFGGDRADVLASYLADDPERAFVTRDDAGAVAGYLIAQRQRLGPWTAADAGAAARLLDVALRLDFDGVPTVLVPSVNGDAARLLEERGFASQRSLSHMRLGGSAAPGRRVLLYGQASYAIG